MGEGRASGRRPGARLIGRALNGLALGPALLFSVPYAGRALRWAWSAALTAVWAFVSLPGLILGLAGVMWEKKLRVHVVVLRDEAGEPVVPPGEVERHLEDAREIFLTSARVRIVAPAVAVGARPSGRRVLEPGCHMVGSFVEDLGLRGSAYELLAATQASTGNFLRLIGYGAPVVVFVVRGFTTRHLGCSLGPLTDYVTVTGAKATCIAHELGHACGLPHAKRDDNLMFRSCGRRKLSPWQVALVRSSRHVTTF